MSINFTTTTFTATDFVCSLATLSVKNKPNKKMKQGRVMLEWQATKKTYNLNFNPMRKSWNVQTFCVLIT